jgi:UDP-N-acetylglucosamine--N-acetylmuramyl-(pentapeptide) pyrophosphoryl-undecaprenol N-acetylglucosamine transferase
VAAARECVRATRLLRRVRPAVVLSVGGYAAGPVSLAAAATGIPLAIVEPNAAIGFTNRVLAPLATRAYVAWPGALTPFRARAGRLYGVPLREGFQAGPYASHAEGRVRVLVLGGSQGAAPLNDRIPPALAALAAESELTSADASVALEVVHQTGRDRERRVRERYAALGFPGARARVIGFLDDVATEMAQADLVVARAGAVTAAEICALGRASLLIPLPHAAGDHQRKNAEALASAGAAVCLVQADADAPRLEAELRRLVFGAAGASLRESMARAARAAGKPRAAYDIAHDLLALAGIATQVGPTEPSRASGRAGAAGTNGAGVVGRTKLVDIGGGA